VDVLLTQKQIAPPVQLPPDKWVANKDNFLKLTVGMTLKELEDIIGVGEPEKYAHDSKKNDREFDAWITAADENRVYRWGYRDLSYGTIWGAFLEPPSAATRVKALIYRDRDRVWNEDKGKLAGTKK
jgi:hypothetical protein